MSKVEHVKPIEHTKVEEIQLLSTKEINEVSGGASNVKPTLGANGQKSGGSRLLNKSSIFN